MLYLLEVVIEFIILLFVLIDKWLHFIRSSLVIKHQLYVCVV